MIPCPKCNKRPAVMHPTYGICWCDNCNAQKEHRKLGGLPEFVPEYVKEDRKKHFKSLIQPFRDGKLSREFVEAYPNKATTLVNKEEIKNAKYMWKDLPNWEHRDKTH